MISTMMFYVKCRFPRLRSLLNSSIALTLPSLVHHAIDIIAIFLDAEPAYQRGLGSRDIFARILELEQASVYSI